MTNILATVTLTLSTNWTPIAEWVPLPAGTTNPVQIVERGNYVTNLQAVFHWHKLTTSTNEWQIAGPVCAERRVPKPPPEISFTIHPRLWYNVTNFGTSIDYTNRALLLK